MFWNENEEQKVVTRLADFWKNSVQVILSYNVWKRQNL